MGTAIEPKVSLMIRNQHHKYWTGNDWSVDPDDAATYSTWNSAMHTRTRIHRSVCGLQLIILPHPYR